MTEECDSVLTDTVRCKELVINGASYLIGFCKKNDIRQVFLTNFTEYYEEILSNDNTLKRCEALNPLLMDFDLEDILDELMVNIPKYAISSSLDNIQLKYKIDEGWFFFTIHLTKCNIEDFYKSFTDMIFNSLFELKHRYDCLLDIVKKKDQEIAEYKAQGVKILRASLITDVFTETFFVEKLKSTNKLNKLEIFIETMNFYNSIKEDLHKKDKLKKELVITDNVSHSELEKEAKTVKRPASSEVRCATSTRLEKKVPKQAPEMKFL